MKIHLENIKYTVTKDEDYPSFTADLYIDYMHAGETWNAGYGSATEYQAINDKGRNLIEQAEAYCKTQHDLVLKGREGGGEFWLSTTLDIEIEKKINSHIFFTREQAKRSVMGAEETDYQQREEAAAVMNREMIKYVVIGKGPADYRIIDFGFPLAKLLINPLGKEIVTDELKKIGKYIRVGEKVLNTNIPEGILRESGLKVHQFMKAKVQLPEKPKIRQSKRKGRNI